MTTEMDPHTISRQKTEKMVKKLDHGPVFWGLLLETPKSIYCLGVYSENSGDSGLQLKPPKTEKTGLSLGTLKIYIFCRFFDQAIKIFQAVQELRWGFGARIAPSQRPSRASHE